MPRSQRARNVTLSKTKPKGKGAKTGMIDEVKAALRQYRFTYVIEIENERNNILKKIRDEVKPGRIFLGKNKAMQLGLGYDAASEEVDGSHRLSPFISGHRGLLFSDQSVSELKAVMERHEQAEFARTGCIATGAVVLEQGPDALASFPHSQEPHLRKLGLPTSLINGKVVLMGDYQLCQEGDRLNSDQCQILKLLGLTMTEFKVNLVAVFDREKAQVQTL